MCDNVPLLSSFSVLLHIKDPCFKQLLWVKPWLQLGLSWGIARASYLLKVLLLPPIYWGFALASYLLRFCPCTLSTELLPVPPIYCTEVLPVPPIYWGVALASYLLNEVLPVPPISTEVLPVPLIHWGFARASYPLRCCPCLLFTTSLNIYLILRIITMFYNNKMRFTNITSNLPHFLYYVYASGDGISMKRSNLMTNSIQTSMMGHIKSFTQC